MTSFLLNFLAWSLLTVFGATSTQCVTFHLPDKKKKTAVVHGKKKKSSTRKKSTASPKPTATPTVKLTATHAEPYDGAIFYIITPSPETPPPKTTPTPTPVPRKYSF